MDERKPELAAALEDLNTIKTILQGQDATFPRVWVIAWLVATAMMIAGLVQYFIPWFKTLDFDGKLVWLWLPGFCLCFPAGLAFLHYEMKRQGTKILGQGRVRHLLFARFVVPPAAFAIIWMASRNTAYSLEGTILLVIAIWQTVVEQVAPAGFRPLPLLFLAVGFAELGFGLTGPEVTLFNVVLTALTIAYVGRLFWRRDHAPAGGQ